jgi:hypothetical protein
MVIGWTGWKRRASTAAQALLAAGNVPDVDRIGVGSRENHRKETA